MTKKTEKNTNKLGDMVLIRYIHTLNNLYPARAKGLPPVFRSAEKQKIIFGSLIQRAGINLCLRAEKFVKACNTLCLFILLTFLPKGYLEKSNMLREG